jgi:predicted ATP-binding protein involved in virulence
MEEAVYIEKFIIENVKGFKEKNEFIFQDENEPFKQWTVILGNNGTGKTTILRWIASLELNKNQGFLGEVPATLLEKVADVIVCDILGRWELKTKNGFISISNWFEYDFKLVENLKIYGYGVTRSIGKNGLSEEKEKLNAENLFFPESKLTDFEEWILELRLATFSEEEKVAASAKRRLELIKKLILSEVFPEISDFKFKTNEKLKSSVVFISDGNELKTGDLGYGYQSSLAWILDFCKKMFERYPESENPLAEAAVLLIDEIDLHLHPKWQRNLIKNLSKLFPKTQFIVTTHSPLIIQSIENINLYILRKNEEGIKAERVNYKNFVGWDVEEILAELLEMEDDTHSEEYQNLMEGFGKALDENDKLAAEKAYNRLLEILNPKSVKRKLLALQLSQVV